MRVGGFVREVQGESRAPWPANDALCAALQIINHLQDCGKDYRQLNRVYIPLDAFAETGASVDELGASHASARLLRCIHQLARGRVTSAEFVHPRDRKSTRLNSSHQIISYAVFCLKKKTRARPDPSRSCTTPAWAPRQRAWGQRAARARRAQARTTRLTRHYPTAHRPRPRGMEARP